MPEGYTIRVLAPPGSGGSSPQKIYHVAIEDEDQAIEAVRSVTKPPTDAIVEVAGELSSFEVMRLGLKAGEVFPVARTEPI